jgi:hypothetical protein
MQKYYNYEQETFIKRKQQRKRRMVTREATGPSRIGQIQHTHGLF